jgi:acyl-CoA synthetase (AMP-forming)/AMP-acid ligase II
MFASFAHPHELFARALYTGASLTLLEKINPKTIIRTINKYSVTCMMGLSPMYEMMANRCGSMTIPSLKIAESGGMFTRQTVNETFQERFGLPILSVWGSTETTGVTLANTPEKYKTDGSMGRICPYYQVKLVDGKNREVAPGKIGELHFKGPGIVSGYQGLPPLLDENGWFASGDMATMDEHGFFYFVERQSGMIKVAGLKVYPLQVELLLLEHPRIAEVAVLGVPDQRKGYIPKAFIVTHDNSNFDYDDILTFCNGKIPSYMIPKQVTLMKELPKIGSGKINKKVLADPQLLW